MFLFKICCSFTVVLASLIFNAQLDLLDKKGEALADKNIDFSKLLAAPMLHPYNQISTWERDVFINAQANPQNSPQEPTPPNTGTPGGSRTPGTTRPEAKCKNTDKPLTALMANNGRDFTISEYPTFWVYIPYPPEDISYMEFLLLDKKERRTIYRAEVKLIDKSGIIKITIPSESRYSLNFNENYRWYFKLNCQPNTGNVPDLVLNGWVQRQPIDAALTSQLEAVKNRKYIAYRDNNIWYDAIANLAELHFTEPENIEFGDAWSKLLEKLDLDWIVGESLVESELVVPEE